MPRLYNCSDTESARKWYEDHVTTQAGEAHIDVCNRCAKSLIGVTFATEFLYHSEEPIGVYEVMSSGGIYHQFGEGEFSCEFCERDLTWKDES